MAATLAVASCTEKEPEGSTQSKVYLKINSVSTSDMTKSVIDGTSFPADEDASIGLFIGDATNAAITKPAGSEKWSDSDIILSSEENTLYGYYPYVSGLSDIKSVPVSSSIDGKDWMWATPVDGVSSSNPEVKLTMNHALALVEVTFNIMGYAEGAEITALTLSAASFTQSGTLDATDGTVTHGTAASDGVQLLAPDQKLTLKGGTIVAKCLLVPSGLDGRQDMSISCTLDGKDLKASLFGENGILVKSGAKSTVSLNVKGAGYGGTQTTIEVVSVGISDWNSTISGTAATVDGHDVTVSSEAVPVTLSLEGASSLSGEDSETVSEVLAIRYDKSVLADGKYGVSATCEPAGACTISHDSEGGIITVSEVTDDIAITISKTVNWYDVIVATEGNGTAFIGAEGTTATKCNVGSSVNLNATPAANESFLDWQDAEGNSLGTDNPLTYEPSGDITIMAIFSTRILSGEFSVAAGRKARFSGGNLWYDGSKFLFEDRQYESSPSTDSSRDDSHISHFMWCGTAADAAALQYSNAIATSFFAASGFTVYGNSNWYTPNHSEIQYLLYGRSADTVCGVSNARWFKGRINTEGSIYINGLFLIPDVFTWPETVAAIPGESINSKNAGYSAATFSNAEFKILEKAGIVFLPAAGSRDGSAGSSSVSAVNTEGFYWISTTRDMGGETIAEEMHFTSTKFYPDKSGITADYPYMAHSVRLLMDVTE